MKRVCLRTFFLASMLIIVAGCASAQAPKSPKKDLQSWNDTQLAIPLSKKVDFVIQEYRIRGQIEHPFKLGKTQFTGYVSEEVFYDWSQHDWVRNRFGVGANHVFNEHFSLDLYLMRQNDGRTRPGDVTILGIADALPDVTFLPSRLISR